MTIKLYKMTSPDNYINKVLTNEKTVTGDIKNIMDVLAPEIIFAEDISKYNYCYIPEFSRYYFIVGINAQQFFGIKCEVDVLYTFRDFIKNQYAIIKRNTKYRNDYLADVNQKEKAYSLVKTKLFDGALSDMNYYLTVLGG